MSMEFSRYFSLQKKPSDRHRHNYLPEITLKLIALNQTPLTENSPYFIKLKRNVQQIAKEHNVQECQAFFADLQRVITQKKQNQVLFAQLITEFESLINHGSATTPQKMTNSINHY